MTNQHDHHHNDSQQEEEEKTQLLTPPKPEALFGTRHLLGVLGFLGFANVYAMRVNLSVAIVAMVNSSAIAHVNMTSPDACPGNAKNSTHDNQDGEFVWDEDKQALVLGSFFWGYIITNPIGGRLGELVRGKRVFAFGVLVTAVLTLLTPVVARTSFPLLIAVRVMEGLGEGVTFPAMNSILARWVPPLERSRMSSLIYAGSQFGTVVSLPISGLLCQSSFLGGWPAVFYLFGALALLWVVVWMMLTYDDPSTHPLISQEEKAYILHHVHTNREKTLPFPVWQVLKSPPFLAIVVAHFAQNWGFYTLLTEMPTYMKYILHFNIASDSFMSALPYLVMWLFGLAIGQLADYLRTTGTLSTTNTRRLCNGIGIYIPMICIVLVGYAGCNRTLAVTLLCLAVGTNGATFSGYINSHLDIAPNFAGTLMGITNGIATIPGFLGPMVVGTLVKGKETVGQWKLVFWISGIVYFIGNTIYTVFVSGEEQPWNNPVTDTRSEEGLMAGRTNVGDYNTFNTTSDPVEGAVGGVDPSITTTRKIPEIF